MLHIALHFVVPLAVALVFYRDRWQWTTAILVATMVVDADHLLADPIYDPNRCSIGFHPLHTAPAIAVYAAGFVSATVVKRTAEEERTRLAARGLHLACLGLLLHMALDGLDCLV
jgi:hypothetical protein